ncbi:ribonuclease J, partial [Bacillus cereus]|nr:ribonuclease J [Bacillus cereus]
IDGGDVDNIGEIVLRDRKQLSEDGMLMIILTMCKAEGTLISDPDTISRGFVDRDFSELRRDVNRLTIKTVNELQEANRNSWNVMK